MAELEARKRHPIGDEQGWVSVIRSGPASITISQSEGGRSSRSAPSIAHAAKVSQSSSEELIADFLSCLSLATYAVARPSGLARNHTAIAWCATARAAR
jgi:hypothetical protein